MKKLTMVMRTGDAKAPAESLLYTLIDENYNFVRKTGTEIMKQIGSKEVEVTNLGIKDGRLVSTNGALKNYTLVDMTGAIVGKPSAVILNRVETEKGLLGYTAFSTNGTLVELDVAKAVDLAKAGLIANGKIRHTQQGDIVASIGGNYILRTIKIQEAVSDNITVSLLFIGSALSGDGRATRYAGVIVEADNAASVTKLYDKLNKSNKEVIEKVVGMSGDKNLANTLGMKVTGTAGFYGIYSITTVFDLIQTASNAVSLPMGKLMIACTDYSDPDHAESNVTLTADLKAAGRQMGSAKGDESLKGYVKTLLEKLQKVTIKK